MSRSAKPITVSVVDDDPSFVDTIRPLIAAASDLQLLGQHSSGEEALQLVPLSNPNVVLMDLDLPGISGIECTQRLKYILPRTQFIALTVKEDSASLFDSLLAGATGYLAKRTDAHRLPECIREIAHGGSPMSAGIARKAIQLITGRGTPTPVDAQLSDRERMVLELLSRGYLYKEVAAELGVPTDTVRNHARKIYEKLQARNRTEAMLKYRAGSDPKARPS